MKRIRSHARDISAVMIIAAVVSYVFQRILFSPESLAFGEALSFWTYGIAAVQKSFLVFGQFPLWDNTVGSGYPLLGHPKILQFYPLIYPFIFIRDPLIITRYLVALQIFLSGVFFYFFLRLLRTHRIAALIGVVFFLCNSFMLTNIFNGFFAELNTLTWLPFIFLFLTIALQKRDIRFALIASVGFSMEVFGGALFGVHYTLIAVALFLTAYLAGTREVRNVVSVGFVFIMFAFLVSGVKLLPVLEYTSLSVRSMKTLTEAEGNVVPGYIGTLLSIIFRTYFSFAPDNMQSGFRFVTVPFFTAMLFSLFSRNRKIVLPFVFVTLVAVIGAFGKAFPVDIYALFYHIVPGFKSQQYTARFLLLTWFTFPLLAAVGIDTLLKLRVLSGRYMKRIIFIPLIIIAFMVMREHKSIINDFPFAKYEPSLYSDFLKSHAKQLTQYRIYNGVPIEGGDRYLISNYGAVREGYSTVMPLYAGMITKHYRIEPLWFNGDDATPHTAFDDSKKLLAILNAKYLLASPKRYRDDPDYTIIRAYKGKSGDDAGIVLEQNARERISFIPTVLPLKYSDAGGFAGFESARNLVFRDDYDPFRMTVFSSEEPSRTVPQWGNSTDVEKPPIRSNVIKSRELPGSLQLDFTIDRPAYMTYADVYYPGWKADLDGQSIPVFMADSLVIGAAIPEPGTHKVSLRYEPDTLKTGIMLSASSLVVIMIAFVPRNRKKNRSTK